jgi:hypothetical protein
MNRAGACAVRKLLLTRRFDGKHEASPPLTVGIAVMCPLGAAHVLKGRGV